MRPERVESIFPQVPYIRLDDGSIIVLVPENVEIVEKYGVVLVKHKGRVALPRLKRIGIGRRRPIYWIGDVIEKYGELGVKPIPVARCERCGLIMMVSKLILPWRRYVVVNDRFGEKVIGGKEITAVEVVYITPRFGTRWVSFERDIVGDIIDLSEYSINKGLLLISREPIIVSMKMAFGIEADYIAIATTKYEYNEVGYDVLYGILFADPFDDIYL